MEWIHPKGKNPDKTIFVSLRGMNTPQGKEPWQNYICLSLIRWDQSVSFLALQKWGRKIHDYGLSRIVP